MKVAEAAAAEMAESESVELESDCPASVGWDVPAADIRVEVGIRVAAGIRVEVTLEATQAETIPMTQATVVDERIPPRRRR